MALNASIPVRFSQELADRLKAVSEITGISEAYLVRRSVEEMLDRVERNGEIVLPTRKSGQLPTQTEQAASNYVERLEGEARRLAASTHPLGSESGEQSSQAGSPRGKGRTNRPKTSKQH